MNTRMIVTTLAAVAALAAAAVAFAGAPAPADAAPPADPPMVHDYVSDRDLPASDVHAVRVHKGVPFFLADADALAGFEADPDAAFAAASADWRTFADAALADYLAVRRSFAGDAADKAAMHARRAAGAALVAARLQPGDDAWSKVRPALERFAETGLAAWTAGDDLEAARERFFAWSDAARTLAETSGAWDRGFRLYFCSMAGDDGGWWLQADSDVGNPYYGASMLKCAEDRTPEE